MTSFICFNEVEYRPNPCACLSVIFFSGVAQRAFKRDLLPPNNYKILGRDDSP